MKSKTVYRCDKCHYQTAKWIGKCPSCQEWNSFIEEDLSTSKKTSKRFDSKIKKISDLSNQSISKYKTEIYEFDRVLGKGITPHSLVLVAGEPGIGKSTLIMEVCKAITNKFLVLYVSGEESEDQIAKRAQRLNIADDNFLIINESNWQVIIEIIRSVNPEFLVIDSIQTIFSEDLQSTPGSAAQVREVTNELMKIAKKVKITTFVIGHVTKEGGIAGPKTLEHMVDTVIYFEGKSHSQLRTLRPIKNRFGSTDEVGFFEMSSCGLKELNTEATLLLTNNKPAPGKALTFVDEGSRSLIVEVQALVVENKFGIGKRVTQGYDLSRLNLIIAIIEKYFEIPLSLSDIYLNISGGLQLKSRESDLAVLAALLSSYNGEIVDHNMLFLGEIGLSGEVKKTRTKQQRFQEVERFGYDKIITGSIEQFDTSSLKNIQLLGINNAKEILAHF